MYPVRCEAVAARGMRPMKTTVSMGPATQGIEQFDEFCSAEAISVIAARAEALGFDGVYVTEHPIPRPGAPYGGHYAPDVFVTLAVAAAATTRLRLHTHLVVLPYRNPFLLASSAATLDAAAGGRVTLGAGVGYVKEEFAALGVDFDRRGELADEALEAIRLAWSGEPFSFAGSHFRADGNSARPVPVQRPHPPIWIGGNSRRAIRRAVEHGDGWSPFPNPSGASRVGRTASIASREDLAASIAYLREHTAEQRRHGPLTVAISSRFLASRNPQPPSGHETVETCGELADIGVTHFLADVRGRSRAEFLEQLQQYAEEVLPFTDRL